jgi:hypothetical protein
MKLGEIELSIAEVRALRRMIAAHMTDEDRAIQARQDAEDKQLAADEETRATRIYETLRLLAAQTALQDGATTIPSYLQARAAWEAFEASEGYYSRYEVDDRWEPDADDAETWELAYAVEIERIKREARDAPA